MCTAVYTRKSLSQMSRIYSKIFLYFVSKIHQTHKHVHILKYTHRRAREKFYKNINTRVRIHKLVASHTKISCVSKIPMSYNGAVSQYKYIHMCMFILCRNNHSKCMRVSCGHGKAPFSAMLYLNELFYGHVCACVYFEMRMLMWMCVYIWVFVRMCVCYSSSGICTLLTNCQQKVCTQCARLSLK